MKKVYRQYHRTKMTKIFNNLIEYPKNDREIKTVIRSANNNKKVIRMVRSKHHIPVIASNPDETDVILLSLEKYSMGQDNIIIDHENLLVSVNAGWTLKMLYNEIHRYNYILETQPNNNDIRIWEVTHAPVHGSKLGAGLIADSIVRMTLIDDDCTKISKSKGDGDFSMYRLNLGMFGIVTNVTFRLTKINNLCAQTTTIHNIFYDEHVDGYILNIGMIDEIFEKDLERCKNADSTQPTYVEYFIDYHNNAMLIVEWNDDHKRYSIPHNFSKYCLNVKRSKHWNTTKLFKNIGKNFRENFELLKSVNKTRRYEIIDNVEKNMQHYRDMFWDISPIKAYTMSYLFPIYHEDDAIDSGNFRLQYLYKAIEFVMNMVNKFKNKNYNFNIDLPLSVRFLTTNRNTKLSPLYNRQKIIYAALELSCSNTGLVKYYPKFNKKFLKFFYQIEHRWKELNGIKNWGTIFGFKYTEDSNYIAYAQGDSQKIINKCIKKELNDIVPALFRNQFIKDILSSNSSNKEPYWERSIGNSHNSDTEKIDDSDKTEELDEIVEV